MNPDELEIRNSALNRMYRYWRERCKDRLFPSRHDIDPLEFKYVLGNIMLLEVQYDPIRFLVRVHGSNMVERARYDMTGKTIDQLPSSEYRDYVLERCHQLLRDRKPIALVSERVLDERMWRYEVLWLPFSDDGERIDRLMAVLIYEDQLQPAPVQHPLSPVPAG